VGAFASDQQRTMLVSEMNRTPQSGAQRRAASRRQSPTSAEAASPCSSGQWTSNSSCRHSTTRAPREAHRALTVTAHILNSSAAAPWIIALRAYRP
jgi:hypothetical protein